MDQSSQAQDSFINLSPLTSVNRQSAYISRPPGPVSLVSLFPMDEQPAQVGLLHNMQNIMPYNMGVPQFSRNPSLIQMEQSPRGLGSSSGKLMLQKPSLSSKQPAHPDSASRIPNLMPTSQGTKLMSTFKLPQMENLAQIAIPPNLGPQHLGSKNKRKSPTEKSPKPQNVFSAHHAASLTNRKVSPAERSLKAQNESFESVRSKLRESLASALVLASGEKSKPVDVEKPSTQETRPQDPTAVGQQGDMSSTALNSAPFAPPEAPSDPVVCEVAEHGVAQKSDASSFAGFVSIGESADSVANTRDSLGMKEEDAPFSDFALKDDLLQENGLCWVSDAGPDKSESRDGGASKRAKLDHDEIASDPKETEDKNRALAASIEAELFRLFGGVNKKYKEKGRSLLFNLKDPSNPELRGRVVSGEITPQRLCSMSAEELASKELTEWRIAKAEEFAHMVVLPDSDVDLRRVVKKTHKGEFQVEVERDDSGSVEVAIGADSLAPVLARAREPKGSSKPSEADGSDNAGLPENADSEALELSGDLTPLPHDMQDLIVDVKGAENLPPIVSLDEFMEALDSEPPFEDLSGSAEQHAQADDKGAGSSDAQVDSPQGKPDGKPDATPSRTLAGDAPLGAPASQPDEIQPKAKDADTEHATAAGTPKADSESATAGTAALASNGGHLWEGVIQLNISSLATVLAFFKSGEKVSTKDWPTFVEVKGRVRVEAFEKFLRDLPLSKSRAMMVVDLRWKEGSPEGGRRAISEAVESYVADGRLGYVEPCPGVELYVCPPGGKTAQMLGEHAAAAAESGEAAAAPAEGSLVGVVVWRRALVESPRPLSSSHHHHHQKHSSSSKRSSLSRKQQQRSSHGSLTREPPAELNPKPRAEDAGEDLPPGFGPAGPGAGAGEEDDLPEFDFRRGSLPLAAAPRPAYQMRELIHKYGQGEGAAAVAGRVQLPPARPWEDDDDDIPEWRPQTARAPPPQQTFLPHLTSQRQYQQHQQLIVPPPEHPQFLPRAAIQPGGWGPYGGRPVDSQGYATGDQRSVMDWRYDVTRSRGL